MKKLLEALIDTLKGDKEVFAYLKRPQPPWCANYRKDTDQCRTGCPQQKVNKGDSCPFDDAKTQKLYCDCYK